MGDVVVSAEWVATHLDELRVVDVRDGWEFDGIGHLPGAVNVPFDAFRGDDGEAGKLPGADVFTTLLSEAGITREDTLLAYDDHHGVFAARFLVTAELYGHQRDRLHLLDGDFSAWQRERETTTAVDSVEPATYEATFDETGPLIPMDAVREAMDDPNAVLVDTREPWEFEEGHIPGAVQLDWRDLVDPDSRGLRPEDELRELLAAAGIVPERRIVLYCNTARRISHTYLVLRDLGFPDLAFYEGSLTEWEAEGETLETA